MVHQILFWIITSCFLQNNITSEALLENSAITVTKYCGRNTRPIFNVFIWSISKINDLLSVFDFFDLIINTLWSSYKMLCFCFYILVSGDKWLQLQRSVQTVQLELYLEEKDVSLLINYNLFFFDTLYSTYYAKFV